MTIKKNKDSKDQKSTKKQSNFNVRNLLLYIAPVIVIAISAVVIAFYLPSIYAQPAPVMTAPAATTTPKVQVYNQPEFKANYETYKTNSDKLDEAIKGIENPSGTWFEKKENALKSETAAQIARDNIATSLNDLGASKLDDQLWYELYGETNTKIDKLNSIIAKRKSEGLDNLYDSLNKLPDNYKTLIKGSEEAQNEKKKELESQQKTDQSRTDAINKTSAGGTTIKSDYLDCEKLCEPTTLTGKALAKIIPSTYLNPVCSLTCTLTNSILFIIDWSSQTFVCKITI